MDVCEPLMEAAITSCIHSVLTDLGASKKRLRAVQHDNDTHFIAVHYTNMKRKHTAGMKNSDETRLKVALLLEALIPQVEGDELFAMEVELEGGTEVLTVSVSKKMMR